jgi:hypothetical protein
MGVASSDDGSHADGAVRHLFEFHVGIPARMVSDMVVGVPAKYGVDRPFDGLGDLNFHGCIPRGLPGKNLSWRQPIPLENGSSRGARSRGQPQDGSPQQQGMLKTSITVVV